VRSIFHNLPISRIIFADKSTVTEVGSDNAEQHSSSFFDSNTSIQTYKQAYVVFKNKSDVDLVLKAKHKAPVNLSENSKSGFNCGIEKWSAEYNSTRVAPDVLENEIAEFMAQYDKKLSEKIEVTKATEGTADSDGWVTVTKYGKKKVVSRDKQPQKQIKSKDRKKQDQKELKDFYRFQIGQSKKERLDELRKKFDEDKARIAKMKESRNFKPY